MPHAPVRVVHVITRMILGGAQESTLAICDGLRAARPAWDTILISGPPIGPEGELLSEVRRRGIPCFLVPQLRRDVNPARDAAALAHLVALFRQLRPTIVHTHSAKAGILGRFAARVARVPLVLHTIRGLAFHPYASAPERAVYKFLERCAARCTDHFAAVAHAMVHGAVAAGMGRAADFTVIRSGIETDQYPDAARHRCTYRRRFGFGPDDVVIGKIARLARLKGHRFLIEAMPRIVERCPRAKFLFLGDGVLREELAARAAALGVRDRIVFAGLVPPREIPACIGAMDLLVHASLHEGLARVLVQALLCEKPVVTFDLDGAPEVILDGITGRLVPPESVEALADAVVWTIDNYPRAVEMAREGRRRFAKEFDVKTAVAETEVLYRRLLRRKFRRKPQGHSILKQRGSMHCA